MAKAFDEFARSARQMHFFAEETNVSAEAAGWCRTGSSVGFAPLRILLV
jgi:hypothetical protein